METRRHFLSSTGKRAYFLERVEAAEASDDFSRAYLSSLKRRRIGDDRAAAFRAARQETAGAVRAWQEQLTPKDLESLGTLDAAAGELEEAQKRGYRTPHTG